VAFNYLPAECEPNACTGNFLSVQTLEHAEYELSVCRINIHAVISHREQPPFCSSVGRNVDCGREAPAFLKVTPTFYFSNSLIPRA
jgi:hypothetical protein